MAERVYEIRCGDKFTLNNAAAKKMCGWSIKRLPLGERIYPGVICAEKVKRRWWQFWKPKYVYAKFIYVREDTKLWAV